MFDYSVSVPNSVLASEDSKFCTRFRSEYREKNHAGINANETRKALPNLLTNNQGAETPTHNRRERGERDVRPLASADPPPSRVRPPRDPDHKLQQRGEVGGRRERFVLIRRRSRRGCHQSLGVPRAALLRVAGRP